MGNISSPLARHAFSLKEREREKKKKKSGILHPPHQILYGCPAFLAASKALRYDVVPE